ncbi:hypothetical protein [Erwinia persicina]|uniref:hypothetical protein n=1 Tax=Erwinia persicina TaxID=55211 RepID=UPI00267CD62B
MEIIVRPFEHADAVPFADAVRESVESLKPWMVWAHEGYTPDEARRWFSYTHWQRRQGSPVSQACLPEMAICWAG